MITEAEAKKRSKIIKTISHPTRIMMVEFLKNGEKSFSEIFSLFNLDKSTVSKHLAVLKSVNILTSEKKGRDNIYTLCVPCITEFFGCVSAVQDKKTNNSKNLCC